MSLTREQLIPELKALLGDRIVSVFEHSQRRIYITVTASEIVAVTRVLFKDLGARMQTATAVHLPEGFEVLYHWAFDRLGCVVTMKVILPTDKPEIDSIAPIVKGAEWIEREMWELVGITFHGHPDMRHLLLMDEWPANTYPMRRDFRGLDSQSESSARKA